MGKESTIELQKVDCNCNDCIFMERDFGRFKQSLADHHRWQLDYFNTIRNSLFKKAQGWEDRGFEDKAENVRKEVKKMKFQFDKSTAIIKYGVCRISVDLTERSISRKVSFIPNTLQLHTQKCFKHRRESVSK